MVNPTWFGGPCSRAILPRRRQKASVEQRLPCKPGVLQKGDAYTTVVDAMNKLSVIMAAAILSVLGAVKADDTSKTNEVTGKKGNGVGMSDPCVAQAQDKPWFSGSDWLAHHAELLARRDRLHDTQLVFLGDSITAGWLTDGRAAWERYFAHYNPLNLGISGDETSHVLWRIEHGELDGITPRVVVLLIGTNDIGNSGQSGEDAAKGVRCIVQKIRASLPATRILLLAVFPRDEQPHTKFRREIHALNAGIFTLHDGRTVYYLDLSSTFLNADGSLPRDLFPDTLHLSAKAYEMWAKAMMPTLRQLTE